MKRIPFERAGDWLITPCPYKRGSYPATKGTVKIHSAVCQCCRYFHKKLEGYDIILCIADEDPPEGGN
jgi:hypothetical protein